jgi:thiamine-phosphate pyrophosphorylase
MKDKMELRRLYVIVDRETLDRRGLRVVDFARELAAAGVGMVQYRDKVGSPQEVLRAAAEITDAFGGRECIFVMNDRADLAALAGWGVHVGQGDLSVGDARRVLEGNKRERDVRDVFAMYAMGVVGVSTHTDEQVRIEAAGNADYVAIGPVFATSTKLDAEPVVGLEGVRRARALTSKPLVAIGGITRENARSVIEAGADSVAAIGGIFVPGMTVRASVDDFLERLR